MSDTYIKVENSIIDQGSSVLTEHFHTDVSQDEKKYALKTEREKPEGARTHYDYTQHENMPSNAKSTNSDIPSVFKNVVCMSHHVNGCLCNILQRKL